MNQENRTGGLLGTITTLLTTLALVTVFVAAGLAICCLPQTTGALAQAFSGSENEQSPFSHDQLVRAAQATRDYTVGSHDRAAVMGVVAAINKEANTRYAQASETELLEAPETYTLDAESLSHLDDVYQVISTSFVVLAIIALVALAGLVVSGLRQGKRRVGGMLLAAGIVVTAAFSALGVWVAFDFNGFFALFHSLFFAQGSWTFSYTSLLITMYPTGFWMGMGAVWLAVTVLLAILAIIVGCVLRRRMR